jgi:hypothetical protein
LYYRQAGVFYVANLKHIWRLKLFS